MFATGIQHPAVYDFKRAAEGGHYVVPPYGEPQNWPAGVPAPVIPAYPYSSHRAGSIRELSGPMLVRPRGQETPYPALGKTPEEIVAAKARANIRGNYWEGLLDLAKENPWLMGLMVFTVGSVALAVAKRQ